MTVLLLLTRRCSVFTRTGWCAHQAIRDVFSLYTSDVFLRELISNANDALEKFRLTSLTQQGMWDGSPLNVTIKAVNGTDNSSGRIIITGMMVHPIALFCSAQDECNR